MVKNGLLGNIIKANKVVDFRGKSRDFWVFRKSGNFWGKKSLGITPLYFFKNGSKMPPWGSKIRKIVKNRVFLGIIPLYFGVFPFLEKVGPRRKCRLFYRHKRLQFPGTFWAIFGGGYPYPPASFPPKTRKSPDFWVC